MEKLKVGDKVVMIHYFNGNASSYNFAEVVRLTARQR
jgi:hypothetical protein